MLRPRLIAQSRPNSALPAPSCLYPVLQILCSLLEEAGADLPLVANPEVLDTLMLALVGSGGMDARAARWGPPGASGRCAARYFRSPFSLLFIVTQRPAAVKGCC